MNFYERLYALENYKRQGSAARRICAELRFLARLSRAKNGLGGDLIDRCVRTLLEEAQARGTITEERAREAEELLSPLAAEAKKYRVHLVAHAHIDMNWLWGYDETAAVTAATFRTMLALLEKYPQFKFSQSQASTFEIIDRYAPELLPEIAARIREGRFELSGATFVENDENMPCAESLVRQILYTRRYYKKLFGEDVPLPELDFQPDTFGHSASVPAICNAGGIRFFYHCRGSDGAERAYVWRGEDGSELLTFCDPHWYSAGISDDLFDRVPSECERYGITSFMTVYGVGDHGGGPSALDIEKLTEYASYPLFPTLLFSTYRDFFADLEKEKDKLPVITGERNFVFSGCYTSKSEIKRMNAVGERRLYEGEALSAMAGVFAGTKSDAGIFETAWRKLLFNQFHDILPGSGVRATSECASGLFRETMAAAALRGEQAMHAIAKEIALPDSDSVSPVYAGGGYAISPDRDFSLSCGSGYTGKRRAYHLFNLTDRPFEGVCPLTVWNWPYDAGRAVFSDACGAPLGSALLTGSRGYWGSEFKDYLIRVKIPAMGYTTVFLDEKEREDLPAIPVFYNRVTEAPADTVSLENGLLRAVFDRRTMRLLEVFDKEKKEKLPIRAYLAESHEDGSAGMTAWKEGFRVRRRVLNDTETVRPAGCAKNALLSSAGYSLTYGGGTTLSLTAELPEEARFIRFTLEVDYRERFDDGLIPRLDFVTETDRAPETCRYGVQLGAFDRPALAHDVPAFFARPKYGGTCAGYAITAEGKYGYCCSGGALSLALLRASGDPDPLPEYGAHRISFALLFPRSSCDAELEALRLGALTRPCVCQAQPGGGALPPEGSLLSVENGRLLAVKRAENGEGIIVRLASSGEEDTRCTVRFCRTISRAAQTDLHENDLFDLPVDLKSVSLPLLRGGIATLRIV